MKFIFNKLLLLFCLIGTAFTSNASVAEQLRTHANAPAPKHSPKNQVPVDKSISEQSTATTTNIISENYRELLYKLLLAETARQRNIPDVALENYLIVAEAAQDANIARVAVEYAIENKAFAQAITAAELWGKLDPNNLEAQIIAVTLLINSKPEQAQQHLLAAININANELTPHILALYKNLSHVNQIKLTKILANISTGNPDNAYVYLYSAHIAAIETQIEQSNILVDKALKLTPALTYAIQLKAKLLRHQHNDDEPALKYLAKQISLYPQDYELIMFYSNALLDAKRIDQAIPLLRSLINNKDYATIAKLTLGEAYAIAQQFKQANKVLLDIVEDPEYGQIAAYYLGQIAEHQSNLQEAINWYTRVDSGEFHVVSVLKAALLLVMNNSPEQALSLVQNAKPTTYSEQKRLILTEIDILLGMNDPEQALDLINNALLIIPSDIDFLYARSIVTGILNRPQDTEKDLLAILTIAPNNANALNALGYTLSNQPQRMPEALQYLQRAIAITPNNPTYMDSMGWLLYRMGKIDEAIAVLESAYKLSNDSEIAAHLGEVLWISGKTDSALKVWKQAILNTPNHPLLLSTLKRLKVELPLPALSSQ